MYDTSKEEYLSKKRAIQLRDKSAGYIDTHPGGYFIVNKA